MDKVRSGESLVIKASTWNSFIDAANYVKEQKQNQFGKSLKSGVSPGIVLVKNAESETRERFSSLVLTDIAIKPSLNEDEFLSCTPVFIGRKMTEQRENMPYAILLEPLGKEQIGRAMVLGIVPAKVRILDADDQYAVPTPGSSTGALQSDSTGVARIIWKGGNSNLQWCLLQLGGAGSGTAADKAYMCRVDSGNSSEGYNVSVFLNGREDQQQIERAMLFLPDIALDSDLPAGTWIIGHKSALKATGGKD